MTTTIKSIETGRIETITDGETITANAINETMCNTGLVHDEQGNILVDTDGDLEWWIDWAEREDRIETELAKADESVQYEYHAAVSGYGDSEQIQREGCSILGIEY